MEFSLLQKVAKKTKRFAVKRLRVGEVILSSSWMEDKMKEYLSKTQRKLNKSIESNGEIKISYANRSRAVDCVLEDIEKNGNTFNNMCVIKNPYFFAPLGALAIFQTKKEYGVKVTVKGKTKECDISYSLSPRTKYRVPIIGLYSDYDNTIVLELVNKDGKVVKTKKLELYVGKMKNNKVSVNATREVGNKDFAYDLTLVYGGDDGFYPCAYDKNGDVRFVFAMIPKTYGFQPLSKGRFLFLNKKVTRLTSTNSAATQMFEVDQLGRIHKTYNVEKGAHHEFVELENDNFIVAGNAFEGTTFEDTVVEIDRKTGDVVNEINIKDYLDPKYVNSPDWAHLNSIEYNSHDKTAIVSLRNLHSVAKINYEKKELVWILGCPEFWKGSTVEDKVLTPVGDVKWFFQQHAAYTICPSDCEDSESSFIILYDNHTSKRQQVSYYDNEPNSYVRIYEIDEANKIVKLHKTYTLQRSAIRSNAIYEKEAGRVIAMSGKCVKEGVFYGEIVEFDYSTGELVNKYSIDHGFYRAYPMTIEADALAEVADNNDDYMLGKIYGMEKCDNIDVSEAKVVPKPILEKEYKSEKHRKNKLRKLCTNNPNYYVDPEQDMARIELAVEEDIAYLHMLDHQLEKVYFVGKNNTYMRDYTGTKQERPEYFTRAGIGDPFSLSELASDKYRIYYKHSTGLYKSKYYIKISDNK